MMTTGGNDQPSNVPAARSGSPVRPNPDLVTTRPGDELVIYHLRTDRFYTLNGTGARIWDLLNDGRDSVQIRQQLLLEFAVDEALLAQEIAELLSSFVDEQLVLADEHR